jgi:DNA (cytosine-5)-methyltransferase 1
MKAIELFAGAGGLALGSSMAGFEHEAVFEWNGNACDTIRENNRRGTTNWPLVQKDVREVDFRSYEGVAMVSGGPPCQPFSIGGKHEGHRDHRNLFPEAVRAVREIKPAVVLLENVRGLMRQSFSTFFDYLILQLGFPEVTIRAKESWEDHHGRLKRLRARAKSTDLLYDVTYKKLNAADYGVPQKRERVFIVGFRRDLGVRWAFPEPTHSLDSLLSAQWITGEYWERHGLPPTNSGDVPARFRVRVARLRSMTLWPGLPPWRTIRDAISDLPEPGLLASKIENHAINPGARSYGGHTGSPIDEPAKTLKAGDHGVPGGENMLVLPDGKVRYFTVRESARLQTFPDEYVFQGSWTETMRQLGNAVAVDVGYAVASQIREALRLRTTDRRRNERRDSVQSAR